MRTRWFIVAVCIPLLAHRGAFGGEPAHFNLSADSAVLDVMPRAPGRTFLDLPPLEYLFRVRADCIDGAEPLAFALNVADSRIALDRAQLASQSASSVHELRLTIPAEQLAPIALTGFCVAPTADRIDRSERQESDAGRSGDELLIPAALAAQASLLCASESGQKITYLSTPLALRLVCDSSADAKNEMTRTPQ